MNALRTNRLVYLFPLVVGATVAAVILLSAGTIALPSVWGFAGTCCILAFVSLRALSPELIRQRFQRGLSQRSPLVIAGQCALWSHFVLAGLDLGRFHWSDAVPWPLRAVGLLGFVAGMGFTMWAMSVNQFFVATVEVQSDRGHHVVSIGPYGIVRHPGYTGMLVGVLCSGLALGSWISIAPMALISVGITVRVVLEDRFLLANLEGYEAYSERVKYRLAPCIW